MLRPILITGLLLAATGSAMANPCGSLRFNYGPFDYRTDQHKLGIVEEYHFTPLIEALVSGKTAPLEGDLDYTLRAFPNHHRALVAMVRLGERRNSLAPGKLSIDCYFERALRFRPDDLVVRMLFAEFLGKTRRAKEAATQLDYVRQQPTATGLTHYNAGLVYFEIGRTAEALQQAHKALAMGVTQTALRDKLKAAGQWSEPPAAPAASPAPASPSSSASGG